MDPRNPDITRGDLINGFKVKRIEPLESLQQVFYELEHEKTGSRMIHLSSSDDNNVFMVTLPTHPEDSTGVAHILEHGVLEGSTNYPTKIFKNISGRSLNTFLNAMTGSDYTAYPYASRNRIDYFNLMDLYMDAVFFPQIQYQTFLQEGWRYEFAQHDNSDTPLEYKGVVFNEMKGAMGNPVRLFHENFKKAVFPELTYRHASGGDPKHIPDLTYQQWLEFHKKFYHPSNAVFYTYGNIPLMDLTAKIEEKVLSNFDRSHKADPIPRQTPFAKPQSVRYTYPMSKSEDPTKKSFVGVIWKLIPIIDFYENLKLSLLDTILTGSTSALLNRTLMESGLGSGLAPIGFDTSFSESTFGAGLKDVDEDDAPKIEKLILDTLNQVCNEGFEESEVHAAIHEMEFASREIKGDGGVPFGLSLAFRGLKQYLEGGDFILGLKIDQFLEQLRKEALEPDFFKNLIQKYLLTNHHRVTMILAPNPGGMEQQEIDRRNKLDAIRNAMSDDEVQKILKQAADLLEHQKDEGDTSSLPTIKISDISAEPDTIKQETSTQNDTVIYAHPIPTNGINYATFGFTRELGDNAPLTAMQYLSILTELGAGGRDFVEMGRLLRERTGGVSLGPNILRHSKTGKMHLNFSVSGRCLPRNQQAMIDLMGDILLEPDFSNQNRIHELINMQKAYAVPMAAHSGHQMALLASTRWLCPSRNIAHNTTGLGGIKKLLSLSPESMGSVTDSIAEFLGNMCNRDNLSIALTGDSAINTQLSSQLERFTTRLQSQGSPIDSTDALNLTDKPVPEAWVLSTDVSYVARSVRTVHTEHPDSATLTVLASLMETPMYELIRAQGGAYGAFALSDPTGATFTMMTYRDPHTAQSLEAFDAVITKLANGDFDDEKLHQAIINVISRMDKPPSPREKGAIQFIRALRGVTDEDRQKQRQAILETSRDKITEVVQRYLVSPELAPIAVVTSDKTLENEETRSLNLVRKSLED